MRNLRGWIITLTCIFLALLALDAYPGLRGGSGWRWPYALPDDWLPVALLALILAVYVAGTLALRRVHLPDAAGLVWGVLGGFVIAIGVVGVRGDPAFVLFTRTVSPVQTGASTLAVRTLAEEGALDALRRWPEVMREAQDANLIHFTTSPPGQPLLHYGAAALFERMPGVSQPLSMALRPFQCSNDTVMAYTAAEISATLPGMLMPLWAALAVLPVYALGRLLFETRAAALRAALWWPLVPSVLLFAPTWNTLYPLLGAASGALLLAGLLLAGRGGAWRASLFVASGVVASAMTFLNFAVLPLLLLYGLLTLGCWWFVRGGAGGFWWPVRAGLWYGLGLASVWLIYGLITGVTPLDIAAVTFEKHSELVERDYLPWLLLHPYDTLMFSGWPLAALFIAGGWLALRRLPDRLRALDVLALATLLTFVLVNLSGVVQGENARILSFYAPFFLVAGGRWLEKTPRWDAPLLAAQALTVGVMALALPVVPLDLNPQPTGPRSDFPRIEELPLRSVGDTFRSANYAGSFTLDSYRFVADPAQQALSLEIVWQGVEPVERPYTFEIVARADDPNLGPVSSEPMRWQAQFGHYLPTCWRPGETVPDLVQIDLPVVSAPVQWTLELTAIDPRTGDRMWVHTPDGEPNLWAELGPVPYP